MASGNRNILVTVTRPGSYPQYPHCQELCVCSRESRVTSMQADTGHLASLLLLMRADNAEYLCADDMN